MSKTILLIGAFDVKGKEYDFIRKLIEGQGCSVLTMNFGVLGGTDLFPIDIDNGEVAKAGGDDIHQLQKNKDRGVAMKVMSKGLDPAGVKISEIASKPMLCVNKNVTMVEAAAIMNEKGVARLFVCENQKLIGVVALIDMMSAALIVRARGEQGV